MDTRIEGILRYHERTKHHQTRYAPGPAGLDWPNQPDPFRVYEGAPRHEWRLGAGALGTAYADLKRPGSVPPRPLTGDTLGILLEMSLGLSAWKSVGAVSWALRCNPSSGNLHPTEGYLVCPSLPGLGRGVYHYLPKEHAIERRAQPGERWDEAFLPGGVIVGLSSIPWREAWKYGERAYRYCQHDAGHALAALRYAAAALGWEASLLEGWADADIASLLGLDRDGPSAEEREVPELLIRVGPEPGSPEPARLLEALRDSPWAGRANRLSARPVHWLAIDEAERAIRKPRTRLRPEDPIPPLPPLVGPEPGPLAADLFRERRSAVAYDGTTAMPAAAFFSILDALLPRPRVPPFDALPWPPRLHVLAFVHRVEGLAAGLYLLARTAEGEDVLREAVGPGWEWASLPGCPSHLRIWRLLAEDVTRVARLISCHQDIAADSCFSLAMLAEFEAAFVEGPWAYRTLFWEAGAMGQSLYLEAEAWGFRGTGIGCYFDEEVHRLLGLRGDVLQDLYHFTVGGPLEDDRLTTLPPYGHLQR